MSRIKRFIVAVDLSPKYEYDPPDPSGELVTIDFLTQDATLKKRYGGNVLRALHERGLRPSENALDLLFLATAIYLADTRISRKDHAQDGWTREIDIHLPVNDPDTWKRTTGLLQDALRFLTGDIWRLRFLKRSIQIDDLLPARALLLTPHKYDSVCLFSGGLDSTAGAVDLFEDGMAPLLVGHYYAGGDRSHQESVFNELQKHYSLYPNQKLSAHIGPEQNVIPGGNGEDSTRSRSFIFLALGSIVADALDGKPQLHVPENGLISLGVPLDPRRLGAHSTRTTHPYFLYQFQSLLEMLGLGVKINAPFRFKTKGELLQDCSNPELIKKLCPLTMSCSSPGKYRFRGTPRQHCGHCVPCIIRRAAITFAFGNDPTTYTYSDKRLRSTPLDSTTAEGKDIRALQVMAERLKAHPNHAKRLIFKPGPLPDAEEHLDEYAGIFLRGMTEVDSFLTNVETKPIQ